MLCSGVKIDSYQRYQNFDALVNKLLNFAYVHVNEENKNKFQFNFEIFEFKKREW